MNHRQTRSARRVGLIIGLCFCVVIGVIGLAACGQNATPATQPDQPTTSGGSSMKIKIESAAFKEGQVIPKKHTDDGADVSPALTWSGVPADAKELALICDDPDAPRPEPWVHWVIYKLPPTLTGLPEGVPKKNKLDDPAGALQGKNSWSTVGYRGPAPPPGKVHHYHFKLCALKTALDLKPDMTKDELLRRIKSDIIAEGELIGTYKR